MTTRVFEREARDAARGAGGYHFDTFHHAGCHDVLDARVQIFGVFTYDDQVDVAKRRLHAGKAQGGTQVGVQIEGLAQIHVYRSIAFARAGFERTLECDPGTFQRPYERVRNGSAKSLQRMGASRLAVPINRDPGRADYRERSV